MRDRSHRKTAAGWQWDRPELQSDRHKGQEHDRGQPVARRDDPRRGQEERREARRAYQQDVRRKARRHGSQSRTRRLRWENLWCAVGHLCWARVGMPTVQFLSEQLNLSPGYLSDMLRSLTGQNAQQHIHYKLIEKAKEILSTSNLSVMRKLKLQMQMSIDGYVARPNGELDWMTWDQDDKLKQFINSLNRLVRHHFAWQKNDGRICELLGECCKQQT